MGLEFGDGLVLRVGACVVAVGCALDVKVGDSEGPTAGAVDQLKEGTALGFAEAAVEVGEPVGLALGGAVKTGARVS